MTAEQRQWEINYWALALLMALGGGALAALLFTAPGSWAFGAWEWGLSVCVTNGVAMTLWLFLHSRDDAAEQRRRLSQLFLKAFLAALSIGVLSYIALFLCFAANFTPRPT
jgi:amino acid transporter